MEYENTYIEIEERSLASSAFWAIKPCINYEQFLDLFKNEENQFAMMGVSDEEYSELAYLVNECRKNIMERAKEKKASQKVKKLF